MTDEARERLLQDLAEGNADAASGVEAAGAEVRAYRTLFGILNEAPREGLAAGFSGRVLRRLPANERRAPLLETYVLPGVFCVAFLLCLTASIALTGPALRDVVAAMSAPWAAMVRLDVIVGIVATLGVLAVVDRMLGPKGSPAG